ncbi:Nucleic acid-binding, OB-fold [Sesbania bispinosa]|nr:Nucleic acid-binding, OB-fold [Sesbania bispinosa]
MSATSTIFIPVSTISPTMENWVVDVQIIRIWTIPFCCDASKILSVEMVFMDAQGSFENIEVEFGGSGFYYISRVLVVANDGNDRPTRHGYRLVIERRSNVIKAERLTYIKFGLSPLTCSELVRSKKDTKYLVDVVEFLRSNGPCTPIIVVQMARIVPDAQVLFGDVGIETVQHVSRILFNPTIPDVFDMHEWLLLSGITVDGRIQFRSLEMPCLSLRDEFLYFYHKKDIAELNKQGKGGCFVICATVTSLVEDDAWWYSACRPHACTSMASSIYTCDGNFSIIPKFSVKVEVSDGIEVTYLQIGDLDMEQLLNVTCTNLISTLENPQSTNYPDVFNRLIGKRMLFVVETKTFTDVDEGCFKVLRTCDDKKLIRMFVQNHFYRADLKPVPRIASLLGERRVAPQSNHDEGSSYASARPGDNFTPQGSATFMSSSAASASVNNFTLPMSASPQVEPPVDKKCVHFTRRTQ